MNAFTCTSCKRCLPGNPPGSLTPGYGQDKAGKKYCYDCCAMRDAESMVKYGRATLYLQHNPTRDYVINWPASLRFPVAEMRRGKHNMGGLRWDVWFRGPDGFMWWGWNTGDMDILHCRRTRVRWAAPRT